MAARASPSPTPPPRSSSNSSLNSDHESSSSHAARVVEQVDGVPLVAEVYENQRLYPMVGWSSKLLERAPFTSEDGSEPKNMSDFKVPPGWAWQGEWAVEVLEDPSQLLPGQTLTDKDGWVYATDFSRHFRGGPEPSTLRVVRRRRHFRRRIPPAKSAKSTLGVGAGAGANSLTVSGYGAASSSSAAAHLLRNNPMATLTNSNLSVRVAQSSMSMRANAPKKAGAGPSLADLYARQTVEAPPAAAAGGAMAAYASAASSSDAAGSPSSVSAFPPPSSAGAFSPTGSDASLGASPSPGSSASALDAASTFSPEPTALNGLAYPLAIGEASNASGGGGGGNLNGTSGGGGGGVAADSPSLRPKYKAFSSLGMSGGLESLSAGFGGFSFAGAAGGGRGSKSASAGGGGVSAVPREEKSMVRLWEHQRYYPVIGWSDKMLPTDRGGRKGGWINESEINSGNSSSSSSSFSSSSSSGGKGSGGGACEPKDSFQPGSGWTWCMPAWLPYIDPSSTDGEGWSYSVEPSMNYHAKKGLEHFVRKRMWQREKIQRSAANAAGANNGSSTAAGRARIDAANKKSYTVFFERLELLKKDLRAEETDDDLVSMQSATW